MPVLPGLPDRFPRHHCQGDSHVERPHCRPQWDDESRVGRIVDRGGYSGRFAAGKQDIPGRIAKRGIGKACFRRQQQESPPVSAAPAVEGLPIRVAGDIDVSKVIHTGTPELLIACRKSGGLDDRSGEPETGAHAQNGARILGDIRLIKRNHKRGRGARLQMRIAIRVVANEAQGNSGSGQVRRIVLRGLLE
jgi:hypothetical protein